MNRKQAMELMDEIHKNKEFHPTEWECKFLEDLYFYSTLGSNEANITDKQSACLQKLYRKSQGG